MLCRDPVGDPLLSRLRIDPDRIVTEHFEQGWALPDDVRNAWMRLEKGLLYVSELLLTSSERSSCGTSARYAIRYHAHFPPPADYGYRQAHQTQSAAERSILRAYLAFRLLVARCSLAVALWLFPGADEGSIRQVVIAHYDAEMDSSVADWVTFLRGQRVPHSWIDAIRDSIITDFSINLRVGTVINPKCEWLAILPVLRAANIPVFVRWRDQSEIVQCTATSRFMKLFAPRSSEEVILALQNYPTGKPRVVTICRNAETRVLPDYSAFDDSTPPFGPYQFPGESRSDFMARRDRYRADQTRQATQSQIQWRHQRMVNANAGFPPSRCSRVYLWVHAQLIYPNLPPQWLGHEYRYPIPPSAYRSMWMVHPPSLRQYNPQYDEWDLWFPPGGQPREDGTDLDVDPVPSQQTPFSEGVKHVSEQMIAETVDEEQELLIPTPEDREIGNIEMSSNFHLYSWYGLWVVDTRTYNDVNYGKCAKRLMHHLAERTDQFPPEEAVQKCISGWTWAMLERKFESPALTNTWDLSEQHPVYILSEETTDPRISIRLDQYRAPLRQIERDDVGRWVQVTYQKDPATQDWSLFTSAMGALLLVRHVDKAKTSLQALLTLIMVGIPARTGILLAQPQSPVVNMTAQSVRQLRPPYRKRGERPSLKDYDAYCQRVLELSRRSHGRAVWLKGGIVWRIMMEITGAYSGGHGAMSFEDEVAQGPSGAVDHYQPVTIDREGSSFYDDDLSLAELDIISGVVRVFTGKRTHNASEEFK